MSTGYSLIRLRPMSWYIYVVIGLRLAQGSKTLCRTLPCESELYEEVECELNDDVSIINATVFHRTSDSTCTYREGSLKEYNGTDGVFGYTKNTLWVDNGCAASFTICYTESKTVCGLFPCESEHFEVVQCERLDEDFSIINATVLEHRSDSNCTYQEGSPKENNGTDGIFGYFKNILWVDNGCRALFTICYTDSETMTSSSSSPASTVSTIDLSSSTYSSSIPTTFSTTTTDPHQDTTSENMTMTTTDWHKNNSQAPERKEHNSDETHVVIIVVPVILVIIVLLGLTGILIWRQRRKRNKKFGKQSNKTRDRTSHDKTTRTIHGYINDMHEKGSLGEGNKNVSANTEIKLNYYNEILLGKTPPREDENKINENKEQRSNEMCNPLPKKNSHREDDTKAGSEEQKHLPKNNPASEKHAYINVEQEAHDDYYLTPVSKKDHSSEADNCINLQPENQPTNNDYKAIEEDHIYDDMDT